MGNSCNCFNVSNNKPQSQLLQELLKKPSVDGKINWEMAQYPMQDSAQKILNRSQLINKSRVDSFHTANSNRESMRKDSHGSFQGTEYMSFSTSQMNMLRRSDVRKLSQRLSAAGSSSRMQKLSDKNDNSGTSLQRRSMSQDSLYFSQDDLTKEFRDSFKFSEYHHHASQSEIEDQLGFSHMNLKDVLTSKGPKVKFAKKTNNEANVARKYLEEEQNGSELAENNGQSADYDLEGDKLPENIQRSKSYAGYDLEAVKVNLAKDIIGRKESVEILDRDPSGQTELVRRSSSPAKEFSCKTLSKPSPEKPVLEIHTSKDRPKKVIVEPLSPAIYHNISLHEENKGEKDEEGASSVQASAETHEDDLQFTGINKEDLEFIKRGQEMMALVLRILRVPDCSNFERLYSAKSEAHKLTIFYDSIQKPNGQTVIKVLWTWVAPCSSDRFVQFSSDFEQQWKVDENRESAEEIEEIYASDTESFVINYLSYKKVLISLPRDVVYLKHLRKIGQGEWAEASVSVKHEDYPQFKDRLRSEIICAGSLISEMVSGDSCVVKSYSETDFKANIPSFMAKTFIKSNLKSYVERCMVALKNYN